ncbi:cytochrome c3 family protein [Ruegeria marina]|uniref:Doubled CXXCH domain-containing protein n=1 Tax=Ruegeria marina TaxID=639004 RepID=A0A1G6JWZ2_9RHOB|nr:multiheme c-type cytochrome [Ruegeria marina]SDC23250.1 doubled CXXCH domain-containing protein [Ruegeria marina]
MLRLLFLIAWVAGPALAEVPDYVGSAACTGCHEEETAAWFGSHHALAWTEPGPDTVLADFDGTEFSHGGLSAAFRREGRDYFATVTEADGSVTDYRLHSVAGIAPLQQYLFETEPGRQQSFDLVWDVERGRWYPLYPEQDLPPSDGLHWTGPYKNWNARCAECHATGYSRNYRPQSRKYEPRMTEIGVGCEACHGPGAAHVDWATGKAPADGLDAFGFTIGLDAGRPEALIEQCAGCHSRREPLADGNPLPGTPYHDAYTLSVLRPGLYHADGQILDEVYVYGSFLQSKMYARGVSCVNCHEPHAATLKAEGNAVCTQCHSPAGNPDFPSLSLAEYDTPAHTQHAPDSAGAQCKSCHMIERTYMGIDGRRDHSFRIPRPDIGAETGGPDACTDCHTDRGRDWAAGQISEWFPDSTRRGAHYGQVLARGIENAFTAAPDLAALALDDTQPGIVRATALFLLQPAVSADLAQTLAPLLADRDPLVRGGSVAMQRPLPPEDRAARLIPLLQDPLRAVRIAAAKELIDLPQGAMTRSQAAIWREGAGDLQRSLATRLDFPETHLVLGGIALRLRNMPAAARAFREVIEMDPQRAEAWPVLIEVTELTEGREAARSLLRRALSILPEDPRLRQLSMRLAP